MRNFQQSTSNAKTQHNVSSPKSTAAAAGNKPDWMKRLQEKNKKEEAVVAKNIDFNMFPSMNASASSEITYLDDEDDLAASFFPAWDKMGSSTSSINIDDDLPPVSGYHFEKLIR